MRLPVILPDGSQLQRSDVAPRATRRLAIVHGGSYFHLVTAKDPAVLAHQPTFFYLPDLQEGDLDAFDTVIVADRLHPGLLATNAPLFLAVANSGGTLVVLGENEVASWLPGVTLTERPTNFWWWKTGEDPGIRMRSPEHEAWEYLSSKAAIWHFHGILNTEHPVVSLIASEEADAAGTLHDAGSMLYVDTESTAGRIIVTTLDPTFHHGSNFMPGSTRFLYGLLRWLDHAPQVNRATA